MYVKIAMASVNFAIDRAYEYAVPRPLAGLAAPGMRVLAPFGRANRPSEGIILSVSETAEHPRLKEITRVLDKAPVLDESGIKLAVWMCRHYLCTLFEAISAQLPSGLWHSVRQRWAVPESAAADTSGMDMIDAEVFRLIAASKTGVTEDTVKASVSFDPAPSLKRLSAAGLILRAGDASAGVRDKTDRVIKLAVSNAELNEYLKGKSVRSSRTRALLDFLSKSGEVSLREACYFTGADPASAKRLESAGIVALTRREAYRRPDLGRTAENMEFTLNSEQQSACDTVGGLLDEKNASVALLHGITGSGKTQIYIRLIERVAEQGGGAIVLAPEIALTPQLVTRFAAIFGDRVALLHSALGEGERYDEWKRIKSGQASVVVGTRSAIFAPVSNLRLIIIDEEHERAYKSDKSPRYHARDVAKYRCVQNNAVLLLGSATPSLESMYSAKTGKYKLITLSGRYNGRELPNVSIADMREDLRRGNSSTISSELFRELQINIDCKQQSIFFLNRRGESRLVACVSCGFIPGCTRCSVPLSYHSANNRLMCHYCGHSESPPTECPSCGGVIRRVGAGTQKAELEVKELFPGIQAIRMDSDTTSTKNSHEKLLGKFRDDRVPVLIGTQMVAKGLDFEDVTLVGALSADQSLYTGDFRASERTFALITQVVGRAGRGGKPGRAVIQTFTPENPVLLCAANQSYDEFYEHEIELRRSLNYPPFSAICAITAVGALEDNTAQAAMFFRQALDYEAARMPALGLHIMGPAPAPVLKVNNKYRYRVMTRCKNDKITRDMVASILRAFMADRRFKGVHAFADFDPD